MFSILSQKWALLLVATIGKRGIRWLTDPCLKGYKEKNLFPPSKVRHDRDDLCILFVHRSNLFHHCRDSLFPFDDASVSLVCCAAATEPNPGQMMTVNAIVQETTPRAQSKESAPPSAPQEWER